MGNNENEEFMKNRLLNIENLSVLFKLGKNKNKVVNNINFYLKEKETLGIVGESGSGKSVTSLSILRLLPKDITDVKGKIEFEDKNILECNKEEMIDIRGNKISMIFQEPMTSLNPTLTVGYQVTEALLLHKNVTKKEAMEKGVKLLKDCGIPSPEQRFYEYPHQMSGGMRQRIMIAMALACEPKILIADEPTTALDVTVQAQILELLRDIKENNDMSIILITHDFGIVHEICDRVIVMYAGEIVEIGNKKEIFKNPRHPYTKGMIESIPKLTDNVDRLKSIDGSVPDINNMPKGCRFAPRCNYAKDICLEESPEMFKVNEEHLSKCFLYNRESWDI